MDKVLVVDNDPELVPQVRSLLQANGFQVTTATRGEEALQLMELSGNPCVVLLESQLPGGLDGYGVCRRIRKRSEVPVILLTEHAKEVDKVRGCDVGADDVLSKPFGSMELLARVKALLRRSGNASDFGGTAVVKIGSLMVDLKRRRVTSEEVEVILTPTEYNLLAELARNAGKVVSHQELLTRVWGSNCRDEAECLRAYIRHLRMKIEPDPAHPRLILSRRGMGYYLASE